MTMTPEFAAFLGQFGLPITILVVLVISGSRGIWVWGRELLKAYELVEYERSEKERARAEREEWKDIALKALNVGEKAVDAVKPDG